MKRLALIILLVVAVTAPSRAGFLDDIFKAVTTPAEEETSQGLSDGTIIDGLKEALRVATHNSVGQVSQIDGYFGNPDIKILFPEKIRKVADVLGKVGFQEEVDDFVLSMNRAAEDAAPEARDIFIDAIKQMTFEDARGILDGGDTAATEYFRRKTSDRLFEAFEPRVSESMNKVGVTKSYKDLTDRYSAIPFMDAEEYDLDRYVTQKSLDGLFYVLGQEEKKIRTDPAARVTDLLKKVFGR
jgi:RNA binding exosome subunit